MGKDLCSCRARPHLLQPPAAPLQICYSNLRWKYPALQGISHVSKACRIKAAEACHGWNVNSCVSDTWGDWAPHKPCGAGHRIRMQGRWQLCITPPHLFFIKGNNIPISCLPLYFIFPCTSLPLHSVFSFPFSFSSLIFPLLSLFCENHFNYSRAATLL